MQPQSLPEIFSYVITLFNFSLVFRTCSPKLSTLSKVTPSTLILDFTGIDEVRCGSNLASLLQQVMNTVALDFSAHSLSHAKAMAYWSLDFTDLDFTGIGELLIVRCGSNLASLIQVVNTVALDFSADNLGFSDSSQSCKIFRYGVILSFNFSTCFEM